MDTKEKLLTARFYLNMQRLRGLIALLHPGTGPPNAGEVALLNDTVRADIGRTIVVFLHATFEDILRTAARQRLATAKSDVLEHIPLIGTSRSSRAEKFNLGALDAHRGKTVDQLLHESVGDYLGRQSFGSVADVERILSQMGLDTAPFKSLFPSLNQMMKRRHRIVHEADLPSLEDSVSPPW